MGGKKRSGSLPPHVARQRAVSAAASNRPPPAATCRGHCKRDGVAAPPPRPGQRGYWAHDGGRVYCRQCRTYQTRRLHCPCSDAHQLRGTAKAAKQRGALDQFEREAAARAQGPGGTRDDQIRMKRGGRMQIMFRGHA